MAVVSVPPLDADVHLVLCVFRPFGIAYVETNSARGRCEHIVRNLLHSQYDRPLRVIALNADEGWSKDVSEAIAAKVREVADHAS